MGGHHRLGRRAAAVLRPGPADARRRQNPTMTAADEAFKAVADEMGVGHTFKMTPVGVYFGDGAGRHRPGPVLRRRRPGAHRLHRVRRVHDRLPAQRQEHPGEELPRPGRGGRRGGPPADDRHRRPPAPGRPVGGRHPRDGVAGHEGRRQGAREGGSAAGGADAGPAARTASAPSPPSTWSSPPARRAPRGCCTACATTGVLPRPVATLGRADPDQLRVPGGRRQRAPRPATATSPRAWRSPRRSTPTRTPTSSRSATARAPTRWACWHGDDRRRRRATPRCKQWAKVALAEPQGRAGARCRSRVRRERDIIALVMQNVDNSITVFGERTQVRAVPAAQPAGRGRAQPDVDPGRQRRVRRLAEDHRAAARWATGARSSTPR